MKYQIHITQKDNLDYFDNKLSKKTKTIERIIRNIQDNQGVVTRRGNAPLLVAKENNHWVIKGIAEQAEKGHRRLSKAMKWDSLTNHQQILLTVVKFDLFDDWEDCEQAAKKAFNNQEVTLDGIPRFLVGQVHVLNQGKYKIVNNNGKRVTYYGPDGEKKKTLEADSLGEFIRLEKGILHSVDFIEEK